MDMDVVVNCLLEGYIVDVLWAMRASLDTSQLMLCWQILDWERKKNKLHLLWAELKPQGIKMQVRSVDVAENANLKYKF